MPMLTALGVILTILFWDVLFSLLKEFFAILPAGWPTATVAIVALVFSQRNLRLQMQTTKAQMKVTVRNQWIHDVRKDAATYSASSSRSYTTIRQAHALHLRRLKFTAGTSKYKDFTKDIKAKLDEFGKIILVSNEAAGKLKIALNPSKPLQEDLLNYMEKWREERNSIKRFVGRTKTKLPDRKFDNSVFFEKVRDVINEEIEELTNG